MTHLASFNIDFRKVVSNALPSFLRKPIIQAFLLSSLYPIIWVYNVFMNARRLMLFKLQHNGQVCRLLSLLESKYPSEKGMRYKIEDVPAVGRVLYTHSQERPGVPIAHPCASAKCIRIGRNKSGVGLGVFLVCVPSDVYDRKLNEIKWLVEQYKLPTTTPIYIRLTN